jgi:hypothetical protein
MFSVGKWCTVTVTDATGRRHSLDVLADSTYDARICSLSKPRGNAQWDYRK